MVVLGKAATPDSVDRSATMTVDQFIDAMDYLMGPGQIVTTNGPTIKKLRREIRGNNAVVNGIFNGLVNATGPAVHDSVAAILANLVPAQKMPVLNAGMNNLGSVMQGGRDGHHPSNRQSRGRGSG